MLLFVRPFNGKIIIFRHIQNHNNMFIELDLISVCFLIVPVLAHIKSIQLTDDVMTIVIGHYCEDGSEHKHVVHNASTTV